MGVDRQVVALLHQLRVADDVAQRAVLEQADELGDQRRDHQPYRLREHHQPHRLPVRSPIAEAASDWPRSSARMPARNTSASTAEVTITIGTTSFQKIGRLMPAARQREQEGVDQQQQRHGAEELDVAGRRGSARPGCGTAAGARAARRTGTPAPPPSRWPSACLPGPATGTGCRAPARTAASGRRRAGRSPRTAGAPGRSGPRWRGPPRPWRSGSGGGPVGPGASKRTRSVRGHRRTASSRSEPAADASRRSARGRGTARRRPGTTATASAYCRLSCWVRLVSSVTPPPRPATSRAPRR